MSIQAGYNQWAAVYDQDTNRTRDLDQAVTRQQVHALDFSENMLAVAKQKVTAQHVQFIFADLSQAWPCSKATYYLITCNLALEHIEDMDAFFKQASDCLINGGQFFISLDSSHKCNRLMLKEYLKRGSKSKAFSAAD